MRWAEDLELLDEDGKQLQYLEQCAEDLEVLEEDLEVLEQCAEDLEIDSAWDMLEIGVGLSHATERIEPLLKDSDASPEAIAAFCEEGLAVVRRTRAVGGATCSRAAAPPPPVKDCPARDSDCFLREENTLLMDRKSVQPPAGKSCVGARSRPQARRRRHQWIGEAHAGGAFGARALEP